METKKQNSEDDKKKIIYQCPMRCEEIKKYYHPGNCPVCNMKLVQIRDKDSREFHHFFG
ncbi:MAG: heavy metal-binding domain-containing protein [Prolixibacteraceae bacterium]